MRRILLLVLVAAVTLSSISAPATAEKASAQKTLPTYIVVLSTIDVTCNTDTLENCKSDIGTPSEATWNCTGMVHGTISCSRISPPSTAIPLEFIGSTTAGDVYRFSLFEPPKEPKKKCHKKKHKHTKRCYIPVEPL